MKDEIIAKQAEIAERIENVFKNVQRIHGKSEYINWIKVASIRSSKLLFLLNERLDADLLQDIYDRNGMEIIANSDIYQQGFKDGLGYRKQDQSEEMSAEEIINFIKNK